MTKDGKFSAQETGLIFDLADTDGNGKDVEVTFCAVPCLFFLYINLKVIKICI